MNRKSISIVLAYIVLVSVLGLSGYLYFDLGNKYNLLQFNYYGLESNYQTLNDTHRTLVNDYTSLNQTHQILVLQYNELNASYRILAYNHTVLKQDYNELSNNYTTLERDHTDLSNEYAVLQGQHESLFNDYNALLEAFDEPLSPFLEEIPSTYELQQWLAIDETDEIPYDDPNFLCGDFAVMLSLHAKLKHWDMGVVGVYGYTKSSESFAHAFNGIICDEGLVYVEPQTDEVWWNKNHEEITEEKWLEFPGFGDIYVEEYVVVVWYD
jgi:hypothetical protein